MGLAEQQGYGLEFARFTLLRALPPQYRVANTGFQLAGHLYSSERVAAEDQDYRMNHYPIP